MKIQTWLHLSNLFHNGLATGWYGWSGVLEPMRSQKFMRSRTVIIPTISYVREDQTISITIAQERYDALQFFQGYHKRICYDKKQNQS